MYAPSSYNETMTGETLSSVSEKSETYSDSRQDYVSGMFWNDFILWTCELWCHRLGQTQLIKINRILWMIVVKGSFCPEWCVWVARSCQLFRRQFVSTLTTWLTRNTVTESEWTKKPQMRLVAKFLDFQSSRYSFATSLTWGILLTGWSSCERYHRCAYLKLY